MGFAQAGVVAGEGKAVAGDRPRAGEKKGCDAPGSIDPAAGENGCWGAKRRSVRRSRLRCSVPGMPAVGKAGNRITWNHLFWRSLRCASGPAVSVSLAALVPHAPLGPDHRLLDRLANRLTKMAVHSMPQSTSVPIAAGWSESPWPSTMVRTWARSEERRVGNGSR